MKPIDEFVFQQLMFYRLGRAVGVGRANGETALKDEFDVNLFEWRMMIAIHQRPGITASQATPIALLNKMQASRTVAGLVASGRVREEPNGEDGRAISLYLTDEGTDLVRRCARVTAAGEMWSFQDLSLAEMEVLRSLIEKLEARIVDMPLPCATDLESMYEPLSDLSRSEYLFRDAQRSSPGSHNVKPGR